MKDDHILYLLVLFFGGYVGLSLVRALVDMHELLTNFRPM